MNTEAWIATAGRFLFEILPTAFLIVYEWAREWQPLITGVLVILAARYFHRATLRSSRMMAEAAIRSARIAAAAALKTPQPDRAERSSTVIASGPPIDAGNPHVPTERGVASRLESLRSAVRSALAEIPTSGGAIGGRGADLYSKVAAFSFDDVDPNGVFDTESVVAFYELQTALDTLRLESAEETEAAHAWEALVHINILARELRAKLAQSDTQSETARVAVPAEIAN